MDTLAHPVPERLQRLSATAGGATVSGVKRSGTRLARVLDIDGSGPDAATALAGFVEAAVGHGCTMVRAELRAGDPALSAIAAAGFRPVDPAVHAAQPARPVRRFEWRAGAPGTMPGPARTLPYYSQTTEFTCGGAVVMLARRRLVPDAPVNRRTEIDLWRQATTVHAPRGPGGCDPFGVACTAARLGMRTRVVASIPGPFLIGSAYDAPQRELMEFVQAEFRAEARARGVAVETRAWTHADLDAAIAAGGSAIVLIDQTIFTGEAFPHWVLVHGAAGVEADGTYLVDDPWVEPDDAETDTDRFDLPVPAADLDRMAWWGAYPYRAVVLVEG